LPEIIKKSPGFKNGDYAGALKYAFLKIDEILNSQEGHTELHNISYEISQRTKLYFPSEGREISKNTGCTACVALITPTHIFVANSGDSRCVLSQNGFAVPLSEDHKPCREKERKRIEAAGGFIEDGRVQGVLNLSRSLGDLSFKSNSKLTQEQQMISAEPDIKSYQLTPDAEFLILACDGIWDCLKNSELVTQLHEELTDPITKKPKKVQLSKVIGNIFDKIIAQDLTNEGILLNIRLLKNRRYRL